MSFKRQNKRQNVNQQRKEKNKSSKLLLDNITNKSHKDGYTQGVRVGTEYATLFAHASMKEALKETKGIGEKLSESVLQKYIAYFNDQDRFTAHMSNRKTNEAYKLVDADKTSNLHLLNMIDENLQQVQNETSTLLTLTDFLSIIDSNIELMPYQIEALKKVFALKGLRLESEPLPVPTP